MNINEYKYKAEIHAHTSPASGCAELSPDETLKRYSNIGFKAVTLTNHFYYCDRPKDFIVNKFLNDFYDAQNAAEKYGIKVILGMEIRFPENCNDYLVYGIEESDVPHLFDFSKTDYVTFYKEFKNDKNLVIQAHPFRDGMMRQDPGFLDGIEAFNMHPHHNSRIGIANQYAKQHPHLIVTSGSDFHHPNHEGTGGILTKTLPNNSFELAKILKSRDFLLNVGGSIVIP